MPFLGKKEEENIQNELKDMIRRKLLDGFTDRRERPVIEVESVNMHTWTIDEDNSDRDKIIINLVHAAPRVWVSIDDDGGKSNDNFQLTNDKPVEFTFDNDLKEYKIENEEKIAFLNTSPF